MQLYATHNRAGEITFRHISGFTYEIKVTIFANAESPAIARKYIDMDWGDNTGVDTILVGSEVKVSPNVLKRVWVANHTYPGPGDFTVSITDPNRNAGVDNMINSDQVPFYLKTLLRIFPISGLVNDSPVLLNDPIDDACLGQTFIHNVGAVDPDGDELRYSISKSFGLLGTVAPGYTFPPTTNSLYVDSISGDLVWQNPSQTGTYNIAILVSEYRNGVLMGQVLRDIQIVVSSVCDNNPPIITAKDKVCIVGGSVLDYPIRATDLNGLDMVTISVTGDLLTPFIPNQASVSIDPAANTTNARLVWNSNCDNIRDLEYKLSIKATDNGLDRGTINLATFRDVSISVIGPKVNSVSAQAELKNIRLNWDNYNCQNASGFKIYRRINASGFIPDTCTIGVPSSTGYELIEEIDDVSVTTFLDDNNGDGLIPGVNYCYIMTAYFDDGGESLASFETCASVAMYIPLMTKIDVINTDKNTGSIDLAWNPPDTLDSVTFPPPYKYVISQSIKKSSWVLIDSTLGINDTTFQLNNLNTVSNTYEFRVDLKSYGSNISSVGVSPKSTSIFLTSQPSDNKVKLSWNNNTTWTNDSFAIYKSSSLNSPFNVIDFVSQSSFQDSALANGIEACYYVESYGSYNIPSIDFELLNKSQIVCSTPRDTTLPCSPSFIAEGNCDNNTLNLSWNNPNLRCIEEADVIGYNIYRSNTLNGEYNLLDSIRDPNTISYTVSLNSIAGCYMVRSVDSVGNLSPAVEAKCVEYCPYYELPNIFTPNGDNFNDLFVPIKNPEFRYVDSIDLNIFNRWGDKVFHTKVPGIFWNGTHMENNEPLSDGVYYYICTVFEQTLEGSKPRELKGTITILDSKESTEK